MPTRRRVPLVLVGAAAFGVLAAWAKGQDGDGISTASQVRYALGNLSTPWLLVGLLAGATCRTAGRGALLGLVATLAALTGFYAMTGAVIDLDGQQFPVSALLWVSANRRYHLAGVVSGLVCGTAGAWWRSRRPERGAGNGVARRALVLTGVLMAAEPLVLVGMGLAFPHGAVQAPHALAPVRLLLGLLGSWTLSIADPTVQVAVYAAEAVVGLLVVLVVAVTGRRRASVARA